MTLAKAGYVAACNFSFGEIRMTILTELHKDHVNLNKLLVVLRRKVDKLKAGDPPNFNLMGDVIHYIAHYADGYHHPREDKLYDYFRGRSSVLDMHLTDCAAEHGKLKLSSTQLSEAIDGVLHDAVIPMGELVDLLDQFVRLQLDHLDSEEGVLFPLIDDAASEEDWVKLDALLVEQTDPLFGEHKAAEYIDLYRDLIADINATQ